MPDTSAPPDRNSGTGRRPPTWALIGLVGVASFLIVAGQVRLDRPGPPDTPGETRSAIESPAAGPATRPPASGPPAAIDGPTVWYSVLGNGRLTLYERKLDGRSEARELASIASEEEGDASFIVSPDLRIVLLEDSDRGGSRLRPVDLEDPDRPPAWTVRVSRLYVRNGIWSPDDRYWATFTDHGNDTSFVVVDTFTGAVSETPLQRGEAVQGFQGSGPAFVVRVGEPAPGRNATDVRFSIADAESGERHEVSVDALEVAMRSAYFDEVAPAGWLWANRDYGRNELIVGDLRSGEQHKVADTGYQQFDFTFIPSRDDLLTTAYAGEDDCGANRYVVQAASLAGRSRWLWDGTTHPLNYVFALEGDFAGFDGWIEYVGSSMVVIDIVSGTSVELPMPEGSYLGQLLAIRGGTRLPPEPIAPPSPVPAEPDQPPAKLVAGAPHLATGSVDHDPATCKATIHVQLMAPAVDGTMTVVDELPPVVLDDVERTEAWVDLVQRPHSRQILVGYGDKDHFEQFLWTPEPGRSSGSVPKTEPLPLPADWPKPLAPGSWRPDGDAIGLGSTRRGTYVWFELGDDVTHRVRGLEPWRQVIGWSADGTEILIGRNGCIDFCDVVQTWAARIRLSDGRSRDLTANDPARGRASGWSRGVSVHSGLAPYRHGARIDFSQGLRVSGDFSLRWPARAGRLAGNSGMIWSGDGRSLYVVADTDDGRALFRIDDPRAGVPLHPVLVGRLPARAELDQVEIADTWVEVGVDRFGTCREGLVDLSTGRLFVLDACVMSEIWVR